MQVSGRAPPRGLGDRVDLRERPTLRPPDELCVFSIETSRVRGMWPLLQSRTAARDLLRARNVP